MYNPKNVFGCVNMADVYMCIFLYVFMCIYVRVCVRACECRVEREHGGLRRIAGYGVTVTRGAASAMMFTYSSLLVTMCRNIFSALRSVCKLHFFIIISIYLSIFCPVISCLYFGEHNAVQRQYTNILFTALYLPATS